jgi:hypothetical protein
VSFALADEASQPPEQHGRSAAAIALPSLAAAAWLGVAMPWWLWQRLGEVGGRIAP